MDPERLYPKLAVYGHFGRTDLALPWEALDCVDALRNDGL
jgi:S-adenosylmethionine synthetase